MTIKLSAATLGDITKAALPAYDRALLSPGIVHFGVGNFHRAHQAVYLDDLMALGEAHDWAIIGAGVREADEVMRQKLKAQDWLTAVVEQEAGTSAARITGVMIDHLKPGDTQAIIARLADPSIRIVSLTITEGGYYIDPASQQFDVNHPDIVHDAANPQNPRTVFGLILAGLERRREAGIIPFTVMSCDNIPGNGYVTRNVISLLARTRDPLLSAWVDANVAFPNAMVDRITPATTDKEREFLAQTFDIEDNYPVFCESFRQWVLEDHFPAGRPALEKVGVQFVKDVSPYEHMKIRILNGGHAAIAYPAGLLDIHYVHEAMENPIILNFLRKIETEEIIPIVPPVPDTDLNAYYAQCEHRFANPKIGDTIRRLALDGSNRQPKFIVPSALDRITAGLPVTGLALVSALWCRYCFGTTDSGAPIAPNDPNWDRLTAQAARARDNPAAWLEMTDIYGELADRAEFVDIFTRLLALLWEAGTRATLDRYLADAL